METMAIRCAAEASWMAFLLLFVSLQCERVKQDAQDNLNISARPDCLYFVHFTLTSSVKCCHRYTDCTQETFVVQMVVCVAIDNKHGQKLGRPSRDL